MEFSEIENHDDFYITEEVYIHTQDQRGVFVMYDVALQDLKKLENQLLLVATQYIEAEKGKVTLFTSAIIRSVDQRALRLTQVQCKQRKLGSKSTIK